MAARAYTVAILTLAATASTSAAPRPPPDPRIGERYDGRLPQDEPPPDRWSVPRAILSVPRFALQLVLWPVKEVVDWGDRHSVDQRLIDLSTSEDGTRAIRPQVGYLLAFRPTFGLTLFDRATLGGGRSYTLDLATGGPDTVETALHVNVPMTRARPAFDLYASHRRRDDQVFSGLDGDGAIARYGITTLDTSAVATRPLGGGLLVSAGLGVGLRSFFDGGALAGDHPVADVYCAHDRGGRCIPTEIDEAQMPGFARGTRFVRGAATLRIDRRDSPFRPQRGQFAELHVELTGGLRDGESRYARYVAQAEQVLSLGHYGQTLVLAARGDFIEHLDGPAVPFSERVVLGGPDDLRGARPGRYRGTSSFLSTVEYRWPVWMWADATLFVDVGGAAGDWFAGLQASRVQGDVGFGFRIVSQKMFALRLQAAYGLEDGWQTFISATPGI